MTRMVVRTLSISLIGITLLIASAAHADWQYTKWGMSPEEVVAASKGMVSRVTPEHLDRRRMETARIVELAENKHTLASADMLLARVDTTNPPSTMGKHDAGAFRFEAAMFFGESGLERVRLVLKDDSQTTDLMNSLRSRYGDPEVVTSQEFGKHYEWIASADRFTLKLIPSWGGPVRRTTLNYSRLRDARGL